MSYKPPTHVLVIDSHAEDAERLRAALAADPDANLVPKLADTGKAGLHECHANNPPDCVILCFDLSDMEGLALLQRLHEQDAEKDKEADADSYLHLPVLMVGRKIDAEMVSRAMSLGASFCLNKEQVWDSNIAALITAVRAGWRHASGLHEKSVTRGKALAHLRKLATTTTQDVEPPLLSAGGTINQLRTNIGTARREQALQYLDNVSGHLMMVQTQMSSLVQYVRRVESGEDVGGDESQAQRKKLSRGPRPVEMELVVRRALTNLESQIDAAKGEVELAELPQVPGDSEQLVQVVQFLVSNAVGYCDPKRPLRMKISARREGGEWIFSFQDNGIGIPADKLDFIFEMFKRLNAKPNVEGTGLGLTKARSILKKMSGRIWAESKEGEGSTFFIALPVMD